MWRMQGTGGGGRAEGGGTRHAVAKHVRIRGQMCVCVAQMCECVMRDRDRGGLGEDAGLDRPSTQRRATTRRRVAGSPPAPARRHVRAPAAPKSCHVMSCHRSHFQARCRSTMAGQAGGRQGTRTWPPVRYVVNACQLGGEVHPQQPQLAQPPEQRQRPQGRPRHHHGKAWGGAGRGGSVRAGLGFGAGRGCVHSTRCGVQV